MRTLPLKRISATMYQGGQNQTWAVEQPFDKTAAIVGSFFVESRCKLTKIPESRRTNRDISIGAVLKFRFPPKFKYCAAAEIQRLIFSSWSVEPFAKIRFISSEDGISNNSDFTWIKTVKTVAKLYQKVTGTYRGNHNSNSFNRNFSSFV